MTEVVYVVVKQGVYMHDTFGPFDELEAARIRAQELAMDDVDGHHTYDVFLMDSGGLRGGEIGLGSYRKHNQRSEYLMRTEAADERRKVRS